MDPKEEIERLKRRPANITTRELRNLAEALGYVGEKRKHWNYRKPGLLVVSIPDHTGSLKPNTARKILSLLEAGLPDD